MANREIKPVQSVLMNGPVKSRLAKPYKLSAKEQASLKPVYRLNSNTTRRAGELQSKYNGKGSNYQTKEAASWVMQTAVNEGTTYLINVIPLPEDWASLEYIAVPATVSGNTITIAPTKVAQDESAFYYIHSWASNDGSIVLTLGEDGSLSTIDGEDIAYSLFKEDRRFYRNVRYDIQYHFVYHLRNYDKKLDITALFNRDILYRLTHS